MAISASRSKASGRSPPEAPYGYADTGRYEHLVAVKGYAGPQGLSDAPREGGRMPLANQILSQDDELVTTQAGNGVLRPQIYPEPRCHLDE